MRRSPVIATLLATPLLVGAIAAGPADSASRTTVKLGDNFFKPKTKTIKRNTSVAFKWAGKNPHNVTVTKGPVKFASKTQKSGTFTKRFTKKGSYTLVCTIHAGMQIRLRVR